MKTEILAVLALGFCCGAPAAEFSVASIRPSAHAVQFEHDGETTTTPGTLTMRDVLVTTCIRWAYDVQDSQISGPAWIGEDHFDILAKASGPATDAGMRLMMRTLLASRFGLAFHRETKEMTAYVITVAKGGHKLKEAPPDEKMSRTNSAIGTVAKAMSMKQFGDFISGPLERPVLDRTGLDGRYDFVLDFTPYLPGGEHAMKVAFDNKNGIIIAALQGELGLKIESKKEQVEVLAIDHVNQPSPELMDAKTTRRVWLAAAGLGLSRGLFAKAAQPRTAVDFAVPPGACDCHTHMFGDPSRFPWFAGRTYTPESASPEEMAKLHAALHIARVVIVTPSVYGTDNSATLYGMQARGANARGIAVIDGKTSAAELDRLTKAGFRGMRLNLATAGVTDPAAGRRRLQAALTQAKSLGWHIQMFTSLAVIAAIRDLVLASEVPIVFDHFGGAKAPLGLRQPGFKDLTDLLRSGHAYVKISGAYRASTHAPDYPDVAPFAKALIAANPDRVLWGSDWPHPDTTIRPGHPATEVTPLLQIDDGILLNQLPHWAPDAAVRRKILVDNPAKLYGF